MAARTTFGRRRPSHRRVNHVTRRSLLALGLVGFGAAIACSGDTATGVAGICDVSDPVSSIVVSPVSTVLQFRSPPRQSDSVQIAETALNRFGAPRTDVSFKYGSGDTAVAVVTSSGLVRARGVGTTTVSVSTCDKTSKVNVTVVSDVASVVVAPTLDSLVAGDSLLLSALALTSGGSPLPGVIFSWTSSATQVATVAAQGDSIAMAHTLAAGNASIQATGQGASAAAQLVVLPRVFLASTAQASGSIAAGLKFSCGIISLGRGYCWGLDDHEQLGAVADSSCFESTDSTPADRPCSLDPQRFGPNLSFTDVSAGDSSACGVTADGRAYCWGSNEVGQLGNGETGSGGPPLLVTSALRFTTVTVRGSHACALATDGAAYCWGQDVFGELGDKRQVNSTTPIPVVVDPVAGNPASFAVISAGSNHTCGITTSGETFCWGLNTKGELGTSATTASCLGGTMMCSDFPIAVSAPAGVTFTTISAGADHTCAIATTGAAYCWGSDSLGQLGTGATGLGGPAPVPVSGGHTFRQITAGNGFTCAVTQSGAAFCWGDNSNLTLGIGPFSGSGGVQAAPVAVAGGLSFARLSAGNSHVCGITLGGAAYCWGSNLYGALGNTLQAAFRGIPQQVATPQ
jgi:alpha-tubulin suppressor-like RCC1 family protein